MKKIILLCCCFAFLLESTAQIAVSVKTEKSSLKILQGEEFDNIRLDNTELLEIPGQPNLPVCIESFVVPIDAEMDVKKMILTQ